MVSPSAVRRALAARLACLQNVEVRVASAEIDYDPAGLDRVRFAVRIITGPIGDERAEDMLDELIAPDGVKQLLEADRKLDGLVADLDVPRCTGWQIFRQDDHDAIGATWTVSTRS